MPEEYGIKHAHYLRDLNTKDPNDIGFTSGQDTLKDHVAGSLSKQAAANSLTTVETPHGLGYRPGFNAYFRDPVSGEVYPCASGYEDTSFNRVGSVVNVHAKSNNYNLVFAIYNTTASAKNVDIFYEVFIEDLSIEPVFVPFF